MTKSRLHLPLLTLAILAVALTLPSALLAQGGNQNRARLLPVLIYSESNVGDDGSLAIESSLIVYNNGQAVRFGGDDNIATDGICNVSLGGEQIRGLQRDLRRAGAQRLSSGRGGLDEGDTLVTVTFFINNQNASQSVANTFTYFINEGGDDDLGPFSRIETVVQGFFTNNFGDCD